MTWSDRILDDGTDKERWRRARYDVVGASDAKRLAKPASVEPALRAKLTERSFTGNIYTESGNRWEPMLLAWAGIPENKALIHHPDEPGFACTPDGILELDNGLLVLGEMKAKHNVIITGPSLAERRQVAWQLFCMPEAEEVEWVWGEIVKDELRRGIPKRIVIRRDDPQNIEITNELVPLATDLLAALREARRLEKELTA